MYHSHFLKSYGSLSAGVSSILLSDSYNEGYNKGGWSGGDWGKYKEGEHARNAQDEANKSYHYEPSFGNEPSPQVEPRWEHNPDAKPGGCGISLLYVVAFPITLTSAVAALPAALSIKFISGNILKASQMLSFGKMYKAAFWTTFTYLTIAVILSSLQTVLFPELNIGEKWSIVEFLKFFNLGNKYGLTPNILVGLHVSCTLLSAIVLCKRVRFNSSQIRGYLYSLINIVFIILPIMLIMMYCIDEFLLRPLLIQNGIHY